MGYALINGFSCATTDSGNQGSCSKWGRDRECLEHWSYRGTHNMTIFGKAVAEILHGRPVRYSYMNGGSGGGRQSLAEAQFYPNAINQENFASPLLKAGEHYSSTTSYRFSVQ